MSLLKINNLGITLSELLFTDLSFNLNKGDRLGLVAANGRGKSTLLSIIAGQAEQTTGDITRARGLRIGNVPQYVSDDQRDKTLYDLVLAALPQDQADYKSWRVDVVLDDLSVTYELQHKPMSDLSGGWQRTALLAAAWVTEPDILLLDEPTNHLDLGRIGLLQTWMKNLPRDVGIILTSHDRAFLDEVTNRTLFLRDEASRDSPIPFAKARKALDEADEADACKFANDLNKAQQLRKQAAKLKNIGINSGSDLLGTKTNQLSERAEKLEAAAKPAHQERSAGDIKLVNSGTRAKALVTLPEMKIEAPNGRLLYQTADKWITPGDRVVLLGSNGTGKTTLIKLIQAALNGQLDVIRTVPSVVPEYSDQHLTQLDLDDTSMSAVAGAFDVGDQRARGLLAGAGVSI